MAFDKKDITRIVTPIFIAMYAWLGKPNTKHGKVGKYQVSGLFDPKNPEHRAFLKKLKEIHTAHVQKCRASYKAPKPKKGQEPEPMKVTECMHEDEGGYRVNFSESAYIMVPDKANPGTEKRIDLRPLIVDAKGQATDADPWAGSKLKIAVDVAPFYNGSLGAGLSLRLKGVQIIELKTGGSRDGASLGFGVEEGFTAGDQPASNGFSDETDSSDDFLSGDDDEFDTPTEEAATPESTAPVSGDDDRFNF